MLLVGDGVAEGPGSMLVRLGRGVGDSSIPTPRAKVGVAGNGDGKIAADRRVLSRVGCSPRGWHAAITNKNRTEIQLQIPIAWAGSGWASRMMRLILDELKGG